MLTLLTLKLTKSQLLLKSFDKRDTIEPYWPYVLDKIQTSNYKLALNQKSFRFKLLSTMRYNANHSLKDMISPENLLNLEVQAILNNMPNVMFITTEVLGAHIIGKLKQSYNKHFNFTMFEANHLFSASKFLFSGINRNFDKSIKARIFNSFMITHQMGIPEMIHRRYASFNPWSKLEQKSARGNNEFAKFAIYLFAKVLIVGNVLSIMILAIEHCCFHVHDS